MSESEKLREEFKRRAYASWEELEGKPKKSTEQAPQPNFFWSVLASEHAEIGGENEKMKEISLRELQKLVYKEYQQNKFEEGFNKHGIIGDIAELGLISTEVSEAITKVRKNEIGIDEELADIIIRVLNYCSRKYITLDNSIIWKNKINLKRAKLHGDVDWAKR